MIFGLKTKEIYMTKKVISNTIQKKNIRKYPHIDTIKNQKFKQTKKLSNKDTTIQESKKKGGESINFTEKKKKRKKNL